MKAHAQLMLIEGEPSAIRELTEILSAKGFDVEIIIAPQSCGNTYEVDGLKVDFKSSQAFRNGRTTHLTERECRLLRYLIKRRGEIVTRDELLNHIGGYPSATLTRTVDVHVAALRQKIEADTRSPRLIRTVHGLGYRFNG